MNKQTRFTKLYNGNGTVCRFREGLIDTIYNASQQRMYAITGDNKRIYIQLYIDGMTQHHVDTLQNNIILSVCGQSRDFVWRYTYTKKKSQF